MDVMDEMDEMDEMAPPENLFKSFTVKSTIGEHWGQLQVKSTVHKGAS